MMRIQSFAGAWEFRQLGTEEWQPASVPGGVHTDLLALGHIPDPFVADNEKRVQWVAESDWIYRYCFRCSSELLAEDKIFLVCDGLDTLATVELNGQELGHTDNMFRRYEWEVGSLLNPNGANELIITFKSPVKYATEMQATRPLAGVSQAIPGGPYLRKAPCHFGWDWGPQLPPIGIWKDIRLEGYSDARLAEVHLRQDHSAGKVSVVARINIEQWGKIPVSAVVRITSPSGEIIDQDAAIITQGEVIIKIPVPNPELWWPNGYGKQPLYQVQVSLFRKEPSKEGLLDQRRYQIGLRTIELSQGQDQWGRSFEFVVNGMPVRCKGSNWIPADSFPTRITDESLEHLIRSAAQTHQNMLRVWGGGFTNPSVFTISVTGTAFSSGRNLSFRAASTP